MDVARGGARTFDAYFITAAGEPVDPPDAQLDILDPDGLIVVNDAVPVRDDLGRYHYDHAVAIDALLGDWSVVWHATIDGSATTGVETFTVVLEGAVTFALYGASLGGVRALLPHRDIDATTKPNVDQVEGFLAGAAGRVFAAIGSLDGLPTDPIDALGGDSVLDVATRLARHLVHLDAASLVEASSSPELARPNDTTSYADWLQQLYTTVLAQLTALVDRYLPGAGIPADGADATAGEPAWSFPRAGVTETTGF